MVRTANPPWFLKAESYISLKEIPGPKHNQTILQWLEKLRAWWRDDETPWCGTFVAHCFQEAGFDYPKNWFRARAWGEWGSNLRTDRLAPGAVLVFERGAGGHVGFYVAEDATHYHVLGGNQSNMVNVMRIAKSRLIASRWPKGYPVIHGPRHVKGVGAISRNEA